ncbi:hypothetical protein BWI17_17165 [Betaproteobacteria bacterium GR16-43]|nr:hypothetical protein BWI17_17165 [Betaproteobacteria bacterium GR16-43]
MHAVHPIGAVPGTDPARAAFGAWPSVSPGEPAAGWLVSLAVFAAYLFGAKLGLALTFLPNPVSVLWPPNAILFAALLLLPARRWWLVVAGAFPAHLLAELNDGFPATLVLCWFVSNMTEALIGASCVRFFGGTRRPFDKPLHVIGFVLAALCAALLSSFLDSAFVKLNGWGEADYWDLWAARSLSNVTTSVVLVPLIVTFASGGPQALRRANRAHMVEAFLLLIGLFVVATLVFNSELAASALPAEIYIPLPFLLWAAYRFGTPGASFTIALIAGMAIVGSSQGVGALGSQLPIENARAVQLFLLFIAPTLLCFASAMEERRRAEALLRQSDKRFHVMLEATRDAVYERDLVTGAMWWSRSALAQFGHSRSTVGHDIRDWCELIHPDDREAALQQQYRALADGGRHWEAEFRLRRADGTHALVGEQGFVVRDAEGKAVQIIGRLTDITDRRDADDLDQKLAHASRLTLMGELAASIAHEINQPMSAILSNVDSAEMLLAQKDYPVEELRQILEDIRGDDLRASEVIRHIRGLAGKRGPDFEIFDPKEVVGAVMRVVSPIARRRAVSVTVALGNVPRVWGDRIHVQQVLLNLIFNGMDAMDDVPNGQRELFVAAARGSDGMVEISVRDRGHGVEPGKLDRIFDSFFTTKAEGMGLGLSIARSLLQSHGGRIWVENNPDGGATFRFTLRVDQRERSWLAAAE